MPDRSFYIVAYDVVLDRRRLKLAKYLESLGDRVQDSVFELYLTSIELDKMLKRAGKLIKDTEDSLRVYNLCSECRERVRTLGVGRLTPPPGLQIV